MAEYLTRDQVESVVLNAPIPFIDSIRCNKGYVYHQNGTGIFILRGITSGQCFATYQAEVKKQIGINGFNRGL